MPSRNPRALPPDLDPKGVPDHVAIVMDGNGRWAGAKGLPRNKGHEAGEAALFDTVEGGLDAGLSWLTVYAFSTENWRRPASEVRFLMNFNESLLVRRSHELHEREVRIRFIGRRDRIPPHVRRRIEEAEDLTAADTRMTNGVMMLEGTGGTLRLDGYGRLFLKPHGSEERPHGYDWADRGYGGDCVYGQTLHAAQHLLDGAPLVNSGRDYLRNYVIEEAIYRSDREARFIAM